MRSPGAAKTHVPEEESKQELTMQATTPTSQ